MSKHLLSIVLGIGLVLVSCSGSRNQADLPTRDIRFVTSAFGIDETPMVAGRNDAAIVGSSYHYLYVFDEERLICKQSSDQEDFGSPTLSLSDGEHDLCFLLTPKEATYANNLFQINGTQEVLGLMRYSILVADTTATEREVELRRVTGRLAYEIENDLPASVTQLKLVIGRIYYGIHFPGKSLDAPIDERTILIEASRASKSGFFNLLGLSGYNTTFLIQALDAKGEVLAEAFVPDVRIRANVQTRVHGSLMSRNSTAIIGYTLDWDDKEDIRF